MNPNEFSVKIILPIWFKQAFNFFLSVVLKSRVNLRKIIFAENLNLGKRVLPLMLQSRCYSALNGTIFFRVTHNANANKLKMHPKLFFSHTCTKCSLIIQISTPEVTLGFRTFANKSFFWILFQRCLIITKWKCITNIYYC